MLQLSDGPPPLGLEQIAWLGTAELSEGHPFRSYGYSPLGAYPASRADGKIMDLVEPPAKQKLRTDPVMLQSRLIAQGMSGAAVLDVDEDRNVVVGLIAERWPPDTSETFSQAGWGVDCEILRFDPYNTFDLPLRNHLDRRPARQPSAVEQEVARQAPRPTFPLEPAFHNAPPSLGKDWAGRAGLLAGLTGDWTGPDHRVAGLIGFGSEGKSSLARQWLGKLLSIPPTPPKEDELPKIPPSGGLGGPSPAGIFWWGFYESRSVDAFLEAALTYLGGTELVARVTGAGFRAGILGELLKTGRFLFVLDGLEVMQHQDGDSYGLLASNDLRDFLSYFAAPGHESFCLITSRAPVLDLLDYPAYTAAKRFILNESGFCLMNLGHLAEAVPFYERAVASVVAVEDWHNASYGYQNLAELHAHLGELAASADAARESLALARRAENKSDERDSIKWQAWTAHLCGEVETAGTAFQQAEALEREIDSTKRYLYSLRGIQHADHLRRMDDPSSGSGEASAYARQVTEANLEICERNRWADDLSRSHRALGDLGTDENQHASARQHYDEALKIARGISHRHSLIEALLARGRWAARQGQVRAARNDLEEALGYAEDSGYRIYEADIRVGLAWAHLAEGHPAAARVEAERAQGMSEAMGYYWGQVDAAEVLGEIKGAGAG